MTKPDARLYYERPIFERLPDVGFKNDVGDWLTVFWDEQINTAKTWVETFPDRVLDPRICDPEHLDYLASLLGFVRGYWSTRWSEAVKRTLLTYAVTYILPNRGTRELLEWMLQLFGIEYFYWVEGGFFVDWSVLDVDGIGEDDTYFYILLPLRYIRNETNWREAERIVKQYSPAHVLSMVAYDGFYSDISVVGEPIIDEELGLN